jgi:hypothetical protein
MDGVAIAYLAVLGVVVTWTSSLFATVKMYTVSGATVQVGALAHACASNGSVNVANIVANSHHVVPHSSVSAGLAPVALPVSHAYI